MIKILGAGYLIYIGVKSILSKSPVSLVTEEKTGADLSRTAAFRMGFLTNVLNPKATLFFLSLFAFVIREDTPIYVILIISFIIIATAITWFAVVSTFCAHKSVQQKFFKYSTAINRLLGGLLIAIGIKIALTFG